MNAGGLKALMASECDCTLGEVDCSRCTAILRAAGEDGDIDRLLGFVIDGTANGLIAENEALRSEVSGLKRQLSGDSTADAMIRGSAKLKKRHSSLHRRAQSPPNLAKSGTYAVNHGGVSGPVSGSCEPPWSQSRSQLTGSCQRRRYSPPAIVLDVDLHAAHRAALAQGGAS